MTIEEKALIYETLQTLRGLTMTREEEIKQAAEAYASQTCNLCLDEYCLKMGLTCPNIHESVIAFTDGSEWADEHPNLESLWHNISKEPRLNQWFIAQIGDNAFDTFVMTIDRNQDWRTWSKGLNIKRWAYIGDLLPKGGER